MAENPKVYCPKGDREVLVWWCLGSFVQQRVKCPELLEATVKIAENYAKVKCKAQKDIDVPKIETFVYRRCPVTVEPKRLRD